jgi:type IV secretion system protein VirD4
MLPQELIQMPSDRLIVLRAGTPPVRGRKIAYYRERDFLARLLPPPAIPARPLAAPIHPIGPMARPASDAPLDLELIDPWLRDAGLAPPPARGASEAEVEAWVEQFIDGAAYGPALEASHAR